MISRRTFGKVLVGGASGLCASGIGFDPLVAQGSQPLVISWSPGASGKSFKASFVESFKEANSRIVDLYDGPRLTQMQANRSAPTFDVVAFTNVSTPLVMRSGLVAPLDPGRIPNLAKIDPAVAFANKLAAPVTYGCWGILYNMERVKTPIQSWSDLLRGDLAGHVSTPNVTYSSSLCTVDALASLSGGDLKSPQRGLEMIRKIRLSGPGLWDQDTIAFGWLKTEELWATACNSAQIELLLRDPDAPKLKFVTPREGGYYLGFNVMKVANSPHPELADRFIEHMLDAKWQSRLGEVGNTRATNLEANVPQSVRDLVPAAKDLRHLDWDYLAQNRQALTNEWDRIVNS